MNTKLTITIEESVIHQAKVYAKKQGRSLSDIIESYLKVMVNHPDVEPGEKTPIVDALRGSFSAPADQDDKIALSMQLTQKYLGND